jgi:hypothetical protein
VDLGGGGGRRELGGLDYIGGLQGVRTIRRGHDLD